MSRINQQLMVDKKDSFFCQSCKEWLTAPIYICKDEKNYCQPCAEKLTMLKIRNWGLENLLENLIYGCDYCITYNAKQAKVLQHKKVCRARPIASNCCNENLRLSHFEMQKHLVDKHSMKEIDISDNVVTIKLANNLENTQYLVTQLNQRNFIIRINSTIDSFQVNVTTNASNADYETPFFVNCFNQGITGKIIDYRTMFDKSAVIADIATAKLDLPTAEEIKLEIIIGQKKVNNVKINECPICMDPLTEKVFHCCNGHMICSNCKPKISKCAICRQPMGDAFFNISNLIPYYITPCPNAADGCFHRYPENELAIHRMNCKYNLKVECLGCNEMILNFQLPYHNSYYCSRINGKYNYLRYTNFNNQIFVWSETIIGNNLHFNVRMLYGNAKEASKYGFKLGCFHNTDYVFPKYALTGICQASSDDSNIFAVPNDDNSKYTIVHFFEV